MSAMVSGGMRATRRASSLGRLLEAAWREDSEAGWGPGRQSGGRGGARRYTSSQQQIDVAPYLHAKHVAEVMFGSLPPVVRGESQRRVVVESL